MMTTQPALSVKVADSPEFFVVMDHFEADIPNRLNDHIRLASDAANVPLKDDMSGFCHHRRQLFSIRDLESP